jgi:hypothetical protein
MPSGLRSLKDANKNAAAVVKLCKQELEALGFINQKRTTLWRRTNLKFDVLKFDIIPGARCEKWRVPVGSFSLQSSCLFPFLPQLGHTPNREAPQPEKGFGQVRLSINKGISQPVVKAPNIWWAGDSAGTLQLVMIDVLRRIREGVLPFFSRFEDIEELLRTFLEDDDAIGREGVWDFGKKGSPKRLLYTGFAAIECGKWDLAVFCLRACKEKTMEIPEPVGERVRSEILPFVDQGLACAAYKRTWLGSA